MTTQVLFNKPIHVEIAAPTPAVKQWTYAEILELTAKYAIRGWCERAVVALANKSSFSVGAPYNWGVITTVRKHPGIASKMYAPFEVRWVADGSLSCHWPEELYFIHLAIDQADVEALIKEQT